MVSIDRVYQTVLTIVNREGMSYINPQEFNLLANQAQIELFEEYFGDKARAMQAPMMDDDYANTVRNLEEKISLFDTTSDPIMEDDNDIWNYPTNFYRLGRVLLNNRIVDEVSHKEVAYINLSPLTAPTRKQAVYTRESGGVKVYPTVLMDMDEVRFVYLRTPATVAWIGDPNYDATASQDFELHNSEFPELVVKILGYIGILIQRQDISQFAIQEEAAMTQNEQ